MESNTYMVAGQTFELQHYGVKGMKWGRRKAREEYQKLDKAKRHLNATRKNYRRTASARTKSFGRSYETQQHRKATEKYTAAKEAYKDQKKSVRENTTIGQKLGHAGKKAVEKTLFGIGSFYVTDVMLTGGATTRAIAKTGKAAAKSAMDKIGDKMFHYAVLDATGKVIRRYN